MVLLMFRVESTASRTELGNLLRGEKQNRVLEIVEKGCLNRDRAGWGGKERIGKERKGKELEQERKIENDQARQGSRDFEKVRGRETKSAT